MKPRHVLESPIVRSYRELMGVGPQASQEDLKKAYHRLALLYHPDRNPSQSSTEVFLQIQKAFQTLSDPLLINQMNRDHTRGRLNAVVVEGLQITFGSFFGFRLFRFPGLVERRLRIGKEKPGERDQLVEAPEPQRESSSILDHSAYDAIELVYAGRFSEADESQLRQSFDQQQWMELPWVTLNHEGLHRFLKDDLVGAVRCYEELNTRIPNNIIFLYRLGLIEILLGFRERKRVWLGVEKPDRKRIKKGILLLEHALKLGTTRSIGKQKCIVIRKTLAEVYERLGYRLRSRRMWQAIVKLDPQSVEAAFRLGGYSSAMSLLDSKRRRR